MSNQCYWKCDCNYFFIPEILESLLDNHAFICTYMHMSDIFITGKYYVNLLLYVHWNEITLKWNHYGKANNRNREAFYIFLCFCLSSVLWLIKSKWHVGSKSFLSLSHIRLFMITSKHTTMMVKIYYMYNDKSNDMGTSIKKVNQGYSYHSTRYPTFI